MCGIAGYLDKSGAFDKETLLFFIDAQQHRGPDAQDFYLDAGIGLAHNRLSILDTSAKANQPFHSADGRYVMTYNGEVYNYKDLLPQQALRTNSDTEVILELFAKDGKKCVEKFRGMFALAIYDKEKKSLCLMRDRLGIKPLYYYHDQETFVFSSELQAIAQLPQLKNKLQIDQEAIGHYLHLGFVPSSATLFKEIKKFPSGNVAEIDMQGNLKMWEYWRPEHFIGENDMAYPEAKRKIKDLLYQSVEEHLTSDVPVGLFLSGGIDSSLLTAIAHQLKPGKIKTFSIGFENSPYDEAPFAKKIAEHIGTTHYESYLTDKKIIELAENVSATYTEPFADTSSIPTMYISEMAAQHVKVVLSGEGADELFLGYGSHLWADRLGNPFCKMASPFFGLLSALTKSAKLVKAHQMFSKSGTPYQASNVYSIEHGFFSAEEVKKYSQNAAYKGFAFPKQANSLTEQFLFEIEVGLKDGLLVKMDRATMRYGIEGRVPYLDHRLVEFALSINTCKKFNAGLGKGILKDILFELVPAKFFNRKKWGFGIAQNPQLEQYLKKNSQLNAPKGTSLSKLFCLFGL